MDLQNLSRFRVSVQADIVGRKVRTVRVIGAVSRTTVSRELRLASDAFKLRPSQLRNLILHGFKRSFFAGSYREKRAYVRQVIDRYDAVAAEHGVPQVQRGDFV